MDTSGERALLISISYWGDDALWGHNPHRHGAGPGEHERMTGWLI